MRIYAAAFAAVISAFSVEMGAALAQDAADAKKFNAPVFAVDLPNMTPPQAADFAQVVIPYWLDNPEFDWLPVELIARSETTLRWARNTRGGGWTKVGVATEINVFAEPGEGTNTRVSVYYTAIQNRGGSFEKRTDIADAAGFYRVAKAFYEDTPKTILPNLQKFAVLATGKELTMLPNPAKKFFVSPVREALIDEAERAYVAGDAAKAAVVLQEPGLANNSAVLLRLAYLETRGEGLKKNVESAIAHVHRAVVLGNSMAAADRLLQGLGMDRNPVLGYFALVIASLSGNTDAMFMMARLHESGWPEPKKYTAEAYRLYFIAGELGHLIAKANAERMIDKVTDDVRSRATADAEAWKKFVVRRKS